MYLDYFSIISAIPNIWKKLLNIKDNPYTNLNQILKKKANKSQYLYRLMLDELNVLHDTH